MKSGGNNMKLVDIFDKELCYRLDREILIEERLLNTVEIDHCIHASLLIMFAHNNDFKHYMPFLNTSYKQGNNSQITISEEEAKMLGQYPFYGSIKENPIKELSEIKNLIDHGRNDFYDHMTKSLERENAIMDYINYGFSKDTDTEQKDQKDLSGEEDQSTDQTGDTS